MCNYITPELNCVEELLYRPKAPNKSNKTLFGKNESIPLHSDGPQLLDKSPIAVYNYGYPALFSIEYQKDKIIILPIPSNSLYVLEYISEANSECDCNAIGKIIHL